MRYTKRTSAKELRDKYDLLIGWGAGVLEFENKYNPSLYRLDYLVNGRGNNIGRTQCGYIMQDASILKDIKDIKDKKACVILNSNKETEMLERVHELLPQADTIVSRLVDVEERPCTYSREREDMIMCEIVDKLGLKQFTYMDIGVCHPVVRNNTYLFYSEKGARGVLVEPNPVMAELAKEYRPEDKLVVCGATGGEEGVLSYFQGHSPGLNTFLENIAIQRNMQDNVMKIPVRNINDIIAENFDTYPDILDIDTEGMDYELLSALDTEKYKIKIICAEATHHLEVKDCIEEKGYVHYCTTAENMIFLRPEILEKIRA